MFSDGVMSYGGIYPRTGVQQEAPKVGPKASTLGLVGTYPGTGVQQEAPKVGPKGFQDWGWLSLKEMFSDRVMLYGGIYPGTGFQQEAPKVGPEASTLGLVVSQRNVQ